MEYINAVFTIALDRFPINDDEEIILPCVQLFPLTDSDDPRVPMKQLKTIEEVMKIPAHPNIPRLVARGIDSHSPRCIALKDVGNVFSSSTDFGVLVQCMDQLKWALQFLHDNAVAHGNVSFENLRLKSGSSVGIQLIGLENAILSPTDDQKKKDLNDRDHLCRKIGVPLELPEEVLHSIAIVQNGYTKTYDYETMEEIETEVDACSSYMSKGTFSYISIEAMTPVQVKELAMLSTHALFGTVYLNESVRCPIEDALLIDYYPDSQNLAEVIHGIEPYKMSTAMQWVGHLAHGIQFLGDLNYVHGAVCPENIQIVGNCVKIFGLENVFSPKRDTRLFYLDPVNIASNQKGISPSSDEYSLRIVIREIISRQMPTEDLDSTSISHRIVALTDTSRLFTNYEKAQLKNLEFDLDGLNYLASCCDSSLVGESWLLYAGRPSLYHLSMVARNFNIFPADEKDIVLHRFSKNDDYSDKYRLWPLIEIKTEKKQKILCFHRPVGTHIQLETTSYSMRNPNRISVEESKCATKCPSPHVFMNRTLNFGEMIKLTAGPNDGKLYLSFVDPADYEKLVNWKEKKICDSIMGVGYPGAIIYRITDLMACVYRLSSNGTMSNALYLYAPLQAVLCLNEFSDIGSVTIKYGDGTELDVDIMSRNSQKRGAIKPKGKPFRVSKNMLNPEIDLLMVEESNLIDIHNEFTLMNLFDPCNGWEWPLILKSVEYKGTRFLFPPEDRTFSDDICNQICASDLLNISHKLGACGHPLFVNIRGLVRNEAGVTGALLDDVEGTMWDIAVMNESWKLNLRDIYLWIKQVIEAVLLLDKQSASHTFSSNKVYLTKDWNAKLFLIATNSYEFEDMDESGKKGYHCPNETNGHHQGDDAVYAVGTLIWDLLHRKEAKEQNPPIDENVGDSTLRALIKICWEADRPPLEAILSIVSTELTKIDLGFHEETAEWKTAPSMGSGAYSTVKQVNVPSIGAAVYKQFKVELTENRKSEALLYRRREVETLRLTRLNELFVTCYGVVGDYNDIKGVLFEKMAGDMYTHIINNRRLKYGAYEISSWSWQIASALLFLHEHNIIHRDIKPTNILVDETYEKVKMADFGIMTTLKKTTEFHGTEAYCAPEALSVERGHVNTMMDIFSFGATLYELIQRKDFNYSEVEEVSVDADKDFANIGFFVGRCCKCNPHERPTTHEAVHYLKGKVDILENLYFFK